MTTFRTIAVEDDGTTSDVPEWDDLGLPFADKEVWEDDVVLYQVDPENPLVFVWMVWFSETPGRKWYLVVNDGSDRFWNMPSTLLGDSDVEARWTIHLLQQLDGAGVPA